MEGTMTHATYGAVALRRAQRYVQERRLAEAVLPPVPTTTVLLRLRSPVEDRTGQAWFGSPAQRSAFMEVRSPRYSAADVVHYSQRRAVGMEEWPPRTAAMSRPIDRARDAHTLAVGCRRLAAGDPTHACPGSVVLRALGRYGALVEVAEPSLTPITLWHPADRWYSAEDPARYRRAWVMTVATSRALVLAPYYAGSMILCEQRADGTIWALTNEHYHKVTGGRVGNYRYIAASLLDHDRTHIEEAVHQLCG